MTREEHLQWAKTRALAELEPGGGGLPAAMSSIIQDFHLHPDLAEHSGVELIGLLVFAGHLATDDRMREYIHGLE